MQKQIIIFLIPVLSLLFSCTIAGGPGYGGDEGPEINYLAVLESYPPENGVGVSVDSFITVTFNRPVNVSTLRYGVVNPEQGPTFLLSSDNFETSVEMVNMFTGLEMRRFTFVPASPLDYNTTYKIKLHKEVEDILGTQMEEEYIMSTGFTTSQAQYELKYFSPVDTVLTKGAVAAQYFSIGREEYLAVGYR